MKRILVLYYSQSGQQKSILLNLTAPLAAAGHQLHWEEIVPVRAFPFPWSAFSFFNAFPETFTQQPLALKPLSDQAKEKYDLVILGYQPWFLTPSRPVSSFLQSADAKKILSGTRIITVVGCRNMWLGAQEKVKRWLIQANGQLSGHIALVDRGGNLTSLITILRWMLTGKKEPFWFFPEAGVASKDVVEASSFGRLLEKSLNGDQWNDLQTRLNEAGAIEIKPNLVLMEKRGQKSFGFWARFVASGGTPESTGRKVRVYLFMYLLPTVIFILTPILAVVSRLQLSLMRKRLAEEVNYFKGITFRG